MSANRTNVYPTARTTCPGCAKPVQFLITEDDPRCPNCNNPLLPKPASPSAWNRLKSLSIVHVIGLIVIGLITVLFFISDPKPDALPFVSSEGRIQPGVQLFIHDTKAYVGSVQEVSHSHLFDDGSTRPGVRVVFKDGVERWIPEDAVHKIYVVKYHSE